MKKTLFVTMLAAALMGGQVYATGLSGITHQSSGAVPPTYYGQFTEQADVTGGDVTVSADAGVIEVPSEVCVIGGYTREGSAYENSITMSGGEVLLLAGGESRDGSATFNIVNFTGGSAISVGGGAAENGNANYNTVNVTAGCAAVQVLGGQAQDGGNAFHNTVFMSGGVVSQWVVGGMTDSAPGRSGGHASNNTVYMTDGTTAMVLGGMTNDQGYDSKDNVVVMTGGKVGTLYAGAAMNGEVSGNEIHLVGEGAFYIIGEIPYAGSMLTIQEDVYAGMLEEGGSSHDNAVNVYGTGIDIGGTIADFQLLNFHLVDAQAGASVKPMLTLGGALDLTGVEITFYADAVDDWTSFEGKTITLAQAEEAITGLDNPQQVNIMNEGKLLTTATLALADDGKLMQLTVPGNVPEPATGTLSLLALAGLAARRRKK